MNCKFAQEKMMDALASGQSEFHGEWDQHVRDCAACSAFFASHASLLSAIDSNLRLTTNGPVPPSLLPVVRVRLQEEVSLRAEWMSTGRLAAIATLIVLAASAGIQLRHADITDCTAVRAPQVAGASPSPTPPRPPVGQVPVAAPTQVRAVRKASSPAPLSTAEILVSKEEQAAFVHFVTKLSRDRDTAIALASAAPESGDAQVEIALLTIKSVEVAPLEGTDSE